MGFIKTELDGVILVEPRVFSDERGYFFESFSSRVWKDQVSDVPFVQDNESYSLKGTIRGLHYQVPPFGQAKLVRVVKGSVLDVAIDIREGSESYGKYVAYELSAENKRQLYIPRGFAHGFVVLSEEAIFCYKCDNYYSKEHEGGIRFNDLDLKIDWQTALEDILVSEKDAILPKFGKHLKFYSKAK